MDMADPAFKPFVSDTSSFETDSDFSAVRSEDASPQRRKMLRSPNKKNNKRRAYIDAALAESKQVDEAIDQNLKAIGMLRSETQSILSSTKDVLARYERAQTNFDASIQKMRYQQYEKSSFGDVFKQRDAEKRKRRELVDACGLLDNETLLILGQEDNGRKYTEAVKRFELVTNMDVRNAPKEQLLSMTQHVNCSLPKLKPSKSQPFIPRVATLTKSVKQTGRIIRPQTIFA